MANFQTLSSCSGQSRAQSRSNRTISDSDQGLLRLLKPAQTKLNPAQLWLKLLTYLLLTLQPAFFMSKNRIGVCMKALSLVNLALYVINLILPYLLGP